MIGVSRLLKSCATPPVSCPIASSFWCLDERLLRVGQGALIALGVRSHP